MGRKVLQHFADVLCRWTEEHLGAYRDLQLLSRRHDGVLNIDLLTGNSSIGGEPVPELDFSRQCVEWLNSQLDSEHISRDLIKRAELSVKFIVELTGNDGDFCLTANCQYTGQCVIATADREYTSSHDCSLKWGYLDPHAKPGTDPMWER